MASNDIDYGFLVGYNGSAYLTSNKTYSQSTTTSKGTQILLTSASVVRTLNIPTAHTYNTKFSADVSGSGETTPPVTSIRMGFGVYNFSGNINFELTENILSTIATNSFFDRNGLFHLILNDGANELNLNNCCWNSISFNYSPNEIPTCSIGFLSNNASQEDLNINDSSNNDKNTSELVKYWNTGATDVYGFTLNFSRNVSPMYHNGDSKTASYLKPGKIDLNIEITCADIKTFNNSLSLKLAKSKTLTLTKSAVDEIMTNKQFNITGINELGMKTYSFMAINDASTGKTFSFS